jgi:hypothetical protein
MFTDNRAPAGYGWRGAFGTGGPSPASTDGTPASAARTTSCAAGPPGAAPSSSLTFGGTGAHGLTRCTTSAQNLSTASRTTWLAKGRNRVRDLDHSPRLANATERPDMRLAADPGVASAAAHIGGYCMPAPRLRSRSVMRLAVSGGLFSPEQVPIAVSMWKFTWA